MWRFHDNDVGPRTLRLLSDFYFGYFRCQLVISTFREFSKRGSFAVGVNDGVILEVLRIIKT